MGKVRKFQCAYCKSIVENDFEESTVICGHCESLCTMPDDFGPGAVIDDFLIIKLLGEGGMGNVYLAHEFSLDRIVALKILKDSFMSNEERKIEFINEARSVASLNDPNIIQAYKVGEENGIVFFVSEYVDGKNLKDLLEESGPIEVRALLPIAIGIVSALDYAWETRKLVHRDIKPENIMVNKKGIAKLMDLGLSLREGCNVDEGDQIKGTPQYISPDQILGRELDNRTDFYCLGATLYHLAGGKLPFQGNLQTIVKSHLESDPEPLKNVVPGINKTFAKIVHKLMAKDPNHRYQNSGTLLSSLVKLQKAIEDEENGKKYFKLNAQSENKLQSSPTEHIQAKKKNILRLAILAMLAVLAIVFTALLVVKGKPNNQKIAQKIENNDDKKKKSSKNYSLVNENISIANDSNTTKEKYIKESVDLKASGDGGNISQNVDNNISMSSIKKNHTTPTNKITVNTDGKIVLKVAADSYLSKNLKHQNNNYGSDKKIYLNNSGERTGAVGYIRFDLHDIQQTISSATLRLFIQSKGRNSLLLGIKIVDDNSWSELTLNLKNAPDPGREIFTCEPKYGEFIYVDLTSYVMKKIKDDKKITLYLYVKEKSGSDTYLNICSKEHNNVNNHPVLIFDKSE